MKIKKIIEFNKTLPLDMAAGSGGTGAIFLKRKGTGSR